MKAISKFNQVIGKIVNKKQDALERYPALMGDGNGNVHVAGQSNMVWVRIDDFPVKVFNNRVIEEDNDVRIWVGYSTENPNLFQVLSMRSAAFGGRFGDWIASIGHHGKRHQYMGQDITYTDLRAFTPIRIGTSSSGGMVLQVYRGYVFDGTGWLKIAKQTIDLTAYIPVTAGKALFVLITIDNTGTVTATAGSEVDINLLAASNLPVPPADTLFVCGAVRCYEGQTAIQEGRTNTDIVDLRFPGLSGGSVFFGDMLKSVYDNDDDGTVDDTEAVQGIAIKPGEIPADGDMWRYNATNSRMELVNDAMGSPTVQKQTILIKKVLYDNELLADTANWDVPDLDQTYDDLEILLDARMDKADTYALGYIYFNTDETATNYRSSLVYGGSGAGGSAGDNSFLVATAAASSPANAFDSGKFIIQRYTGSKFKDVISLFHNRRSAADSYAFAAGLQWESTSPINRVKVAAETGSKFAAGSRLRIVGVKELAVVTQVNVGDTIGNMNYLGAWSGATAYVLNDVVENGGVTYICISAHTNQEPPNGTYWEVLGSSTYIPSSYLDTDGTLAANSDTKIATQKATKTYVDTAVTGLLDFKGSTDCSSNPNYPAASKGDAYVVSVAGKIGGASGKTVDVSDVYLAIADNAGGTEAAVGASWSVLEHNLVGALLSANNLSDLASAPTARTNLGLGDSATKNVGTGAGDVAIGSHVSDVNNPHDVTATQVGAPDIGFAVNINDDSVYSFTPRTSIGFILIQQTPGSGAAASVNFLIGFFYKTSYVGLQSLAIGANFEITTGALTGTTGTDGKLTISYNISDGRIYVENRRGVTVAVNVQVLPR